MRPFLTDSPPPPPRDKLSHCGLTAGSGRALRTALAGLLALLVAAGWSTEASAQATVSPNYVCQGQTADLEISGTAPYSNVSYVPDGDSLGWGSAWNALSVVGGRVNSGPAVFVLENHQGGESYTTTLRIQNISADGSVTLVAHNADSVTINFHPATHANCTAPTDGVTVEPTTLALEELHATDAEKTYTVVLNTDPTADVTITATVPAANTSEVQVKTGSGTFGSSATLTFTAGGDGSGSGTGNGNWGTAQTVTVQAVNDGNITDTASFNLTHALTASSGPYQSITPDPVAVSVTDAGHGVTVSKASLSVAENSETATYTVVLKSQPGGTVVITPTSSASANATVSGALTFTNSNWDTAQTVTVTGAGTGSPTVSHMVTTAATGYPTSTPIPSVTVTADTRPEVIITPDGATVAEGDDDPATAGTQQRPVRFIFEGPADLASNLTVSFTVSEEGSLLAPGARETRANLSPGVFHRNSRTVANVDDDATDEPNGSVTVTLSASADYRIGDPGTATVILVDNDPTAVTLAGGGTVAEDGSDSADVTVTLGRALVAGESVTVPLAVSGTGVTASDYAIGLKSGTTLNSGVALDTTSPHSAATPAVVFTGHATNTVSIATLTISARQDTTDEGASETLAVGFDSGNRAVTSNLDRASGTGTAGTTPSGTAGVTITDDDDSVSPGLALTESGTPAQTEVGEAIGTDTYTVALKTAPTAAVTVTATAGAGVQVQASGGTAAATAVLTFTPGGATIWSTAQTITVTGVDDDIDNAGDARAASITHASASSDTRYAIASAGSISVSVTDDDTAAVTVSQSTRTVDENSGTATYTVVLATEPLRSVTVTAASDDGAVVRVDGPDAGSAASVSETLTFTTSNWNAPQTVTLVGQDDAVTNASARTAAVSHEIATAAAGDGGKYTPTTPTIAGVAVTLTDNDVTLSLASSKAAEGNSSTRDVDVTVAKPADSADISYSLCFGGTATRDDDGTPAAGEDYQVIRPGGGVQTGFTGTCVGTQTPPRWTTSSDTNTWKIRVRGDADAESDETVIVTLAEVAGHALPGALEIPASAGTATYTIEDDDTVPGLTLSPTRLTVDENAGTGTYTVALNTVPANTVTVTVTASAGVQVNTSDGTAGSTQTLTFTPGGATAWNTAQSITVTGVDDDIDNAGDARTVAIAHAAQSADSNYTILSAGSVQVSVTDDDTAAVTVLAPSLTMAEAGGTAMYTVELGSEPLRTVTVTVESDDSAAALLDGPDSSTAYTGSEELAFTASNWDTAQTIRVQGVDDSVVNTPARTATLTHSIKSAAHGDGGRYLPALSDPEVDVTLTDDEEATPELSLSVASQRADEGDAGQSDVAITVSLSVARVGATAFKLCAAPDEGSNSTAVLRTAHGHEAADYDLVDSGGTALALDGDDCASLSLAAGATVMTVKIRVFGDSSAERPEHVVLELRDAPAGVEIADPGGTARYRIDNDDGNPVQVGTVTAGAAVVEGSPARFPLTVSGPAAAMLHYTVSDDDASDFVASGGEGAQTLALVAGTTNYTIEVPTVNDTTDEADGAVSVTLSRGDGYIFQGGAATRRATVSVTDDDLPAGTPAASFASGTASAGEGAGTHNVTVNLSPAPQAGITLAYTLSGTATRGTDYAISGVSSNSATVAVAAGATSVTIAVAITDDGDDESNETVILTLGAGTGYTVGSTSVHTLTITDDDTAGVTVTPTSRTVAEVGGTATYTVMLDSRPSGSVTITAASGNAAVELEGPDADSAYSASEALVFTTANWGAAQTVTVRGVDDSVVNSPARSATVSHSIQAGHGDGVGYRPNLISIEAVTVTLTDDDTADPAVSFASGTSSVSESAGTRSVTVNLNPAPQAGITLAYTLSGTASRGTDYAISGVSSNSATLAVTAGATSVTIAVAITDDGDDESNETVILTLGAGTGYTVGSTSVHTLTITDDDTAGVTVTPTSRTVAEAGGTATYTVVLDSRPSGSVTITAASGNAAVELEGPDADSTYSGEERLVFTTANWGAAQTVTVRGVDDSVVNSPARSATVSHSIQAGHGDGVGYRPNLISIEAVTVTLTDDDTAATPAASFASGTASAGEGAGTHNVTVNLTSAAPSGGLTLAYTLSGTATRGMDYAISGVSSNSATVAVAAGATSATIAIAITDDGDDESNETVILTLGTGPGTGYTVGPPNTHTLTITDNDDAPPPAVSFAAPASQAPEAAQARSIPVRLDRAPAEPLVLAYTVTGTAAAGSDYTIAGSGSLSVAAGGRSATLSVTVLDDDEAEDDETVVLALAAGAGYTVGSPGTHTLTIQGNDRTGAQAATRGWLARFGRTVADQVIEAVQGRLRSPAAPPESSLRLAGRDWQAAGSGPADPDPLRAPAGVSVSGTEAPAARADAPPIPEAAPERLSDLDWLGGTAFHTARKNSSGLTSLWGRGAVAQFDGRESGNRLDGRVESVLLGADYTQDGRALGFLLSHSRGEGGWRGRDADGRFKAELTGLHQYARYQANAHWSLWSVAGYGQGNLKRTEGSQTRRGDLDAWLVAGGLRGEMRGAAALWPALSMVADVLWVDTQTDGEAGFSSVDADVSRIRAGLEGTWTPLPLGHGQLSPRLRISLRHDGGDAEHGFGTEVRAGADWVDARHGLRAQVQAHTLLTHEEDGAQEKGFSGSLSWDPRPDSLRGAEFSLAARTGAQPDRDGLLSGAAFGTAPARESASSWEATLGYGVGAFGDRFTAVPEANLAWSADAWDLGLGWRLVAERFDLRVQARRREESPGGADEEIRVRLQGRW